MKKRLLPWRRPGSVPMTFTNFTRKALVPFAAATMLSACAADTGPAPVYNAAIEQRDTSQPVVMVNKGDDLMQLAKRNGLTIEDILQANNLMDATQARGGARLFMPGNGPQNGPTMPQGFPGEPQMAQNEMQAMEPVSYNQDSNDIQSETLAPLTQAAQPQQQDSDLQALPGPSAAPEPVKLASNLPPEQWRDPMTSGFRWPVKGPTLSNYGQKLDGLRNDGINIGALSGTPVEAAADGEVVYAGNAVEGFGNLVLLKHKNNVVTAYGHLGRMDVTKGQAIKAGEIIGGVGETGSVGAPQLHFQIRQGGKILDPSQFLHRGGTTQTAGL